jgi:serine/threonine protein kinase
VEYGVTESKPPDERETPDVEQAALPSPHPASKIDTLPENIVRVLSRRPLFVGDVIAGRYRIVESLGDGGMGQVFVAENVAIARRVAIKVLKPEVLADATFRHRFQREAEACAAIEHRNVARFFDLIIGDPTFLVMEYVPGPTLGSYLREKGPMAADRAIAITTRLCWALHAAHSAGVVHRDIKPSNVILAPDPEIGEEPKLIDFGLAKLASNSGAQKLTRQGQIVGTPHYMSPEQIAGREVDPRSDVYSLGCVLYQMLTGRPPFTGDDDVQVFYQQIERQPRPISQFVASVPPGLEPVLMRALHKDPRKRFQTMEEMARELTEIAKPPAAMVSQAPPARTPVKFTRRLVLGTSLAIATALALGYLAARLKAAPAKDARSAEGTLLMVNSSPKGANVELDGKPLPQTTPTVISGLRPGKHTLRVRDSAGTPVEEVVTIRQNERAAVDVTLPPASRTVEVQTAPSGAVVYVDDHLAVGRTPLRIQVSENDFHAVRIEKDGYEPLSYAIKPEHSQRLLSFALGVERLPRGTLWVDANQAAQVFIDGAETGLVTPTPGIRVAVGEHAVELRDGSGAVTASAKVKIAQGQSLHLTLGSERSNRGER